MERLFKMLMGIYPMSPELIDYLKATLEVFELSKRQYLLKKGQISNRIYFVAKGILRCYYIDNNQKQTTKWFMDEGHVIIAVDSFFNRTLSFEAIQALEDCLLYGITYEQLEEAYRRFVEFNFHGRVLTTKYYVFSDQRVTMLQRLNAPERYLFTKEKQPGIVDRHSVTSRDLSSYLGIDEATLSRIKKKYDLS
jgi:CRP-like cAMP-binding protein